MGYQNIILLIIFSIALSSLNNKFTSEINQLQENIEYIQKNVEPSKIDSIFELKISQENEIAQLNEKLSSEIENRKQAINSESQRAINSEKELNDSIMNEQEIRNGQITTINSRISSLINNNDPSALDSIKEAVDYVNNQDSSILNELTNTKNNLSDEIERAKSSESQIKSLLQNEIQNRTLALNEESESRQNAINEAKVIFADEIEKSGKALGEAIGLERDMRTESIETLQKQTEENLQIASQALGEAIGLERDMRTESIETLQKQTEENLQIASQALGEAIGLERTMRIESIETLQKQTEENLQIASQALGEAIGLERDMRTESIETLQKQTEENLQIASQALGEAIGLERDMRTESIETLQKQTEENLQIASQALGEAIGLERDMRTESIETLQKQTEENLQIASQALGEAIGLERDMRTESIETLQKQTEENQNNINQNIDDLTNQTLSLINRNTLDLSNSIIQANNRCAEKSNKNRTLINVLDETISRNQEIILDSTRRNDCEIRSLVQILTEQFNNIQKKIRVLEGKDEFSLVPFQNFKKAINDNFKISTLNRYFIHDIIGIFLLSEIPNNNKYPFYISYRYRSCIPDDNNIYYSYNDSRYADVIFKENDEVEFNFRLSGDGTNLPTDFLAAGGVIDTSGTQVYIHETTMPLENLPSLNILKSVITETYYVEQTKNNLPIKSIIEIQDIIAKNYFSSCNQWRFAIKIQLNLNGLITSEYRYGVWEGSTFKFDTNPDFESLRNQAKNDTQGVLAYEWDNWIVDKPLPNINEISFQLKPVGNNPAQITAYLYSEYNRSYLSHADFTVSQIQNMIENDESNIYNVRIPDGKYRLVMYDSGTIPNNDIGWEGASWNMTSSDNTTFSHTLSGNSGTINFSVESGLITILSLNDGAEEYVEPEEPAESAFLIIKADGSEQVPPGYRPIPLNEAVLIQDKLTALVASEEGTWGIIALAYPYRIGGPGYNGQVKDESANGRSPHGDWANFIAKVFLIKGPIEDQL